MNFRRQILLINNLFAAKIFSCSHVNKPIKKCLLLWGGNICLLQAKGDANRQLAFARRYNARDKCILIEVPEPRSGAIWGVFRLFVTRSFGRINKN